MRLPRHSVDPFTDLNERDTGPEAANTGRGQPHPTAVPRQAGRHPGTVDQVLAGRAPEQPPSITAPRPSAHAAPSASYRRLRALRDESGCGTSAIDLRHAGCWRDRHPRPLPHRTGRVEDLWWHTAGGSHPAVGTPVRAPWRDAEGGELARLRRGASDLSTFSTSGGVPVKCGDRLGSRSRYSRCPVGWGARNRRGTRAQLRPAG